MKKPYHLIIDYYKENNGVDYTEEINEIVMLESVYRERLSSNRPLNRKDKDILLEIIRLLVD
jgi:hypothetical protein